MVDTPVQVFGATGHMGRSVVKAALNHGDIVTAVGRTFENSLQSMQNWCPSTSTAPNGASSATNKTSTNGINLSSITTPPPTNTGNTPPQQPTPATSKNYLGLLCDVRVRETVAAVFKTAIAHWGHVDVIANCSGYGVIGSCEDQDEYEIRNQFETNFWGTLNIIQLSLPYFRMRPNGEGGRYLIFSSTSGALGVPGLGPYCATKYAVEGLIESMLYEIDAFNIKATLVEPGHVRRDDTDVMGGAVPLPKFGHFFIKPASEAYSGPTAPAGHAKRMVQWLGDKQPTSAVKAAELVWQLAHCSFPPLRLLLGSYAVESVRDRFRSIIEEIEDWKFLSFPVTGSGTDGAGGSGKNDGDRDGKRKSTDDDEERTSSREHLDYDEDMVDGDGDEDHDSQDENDDDKDEDMDDDRDVAASSP
ncbi:hypothetical protein MMC25_005274 [Agyrium rufum]|nr:hypothetical protein [Agyrium rufum]